MDQTLGRETPLHWPRRARQGHLSRGAAGGIARYAVGLLLLVTFLFHFASPTRAASSGFTEEAIRFQSGDITLSGTILAPDGPGRKPALALVHGAGRGLRETNRLEAEAFARGGIVTLIYDKRTVGYSLTERSYGLLADDALAAVRALRARPDVDPAAVGLWGVSEGGWVVPIAASRSDEVAFAVLVAASGVPPARQHAWYLENQLRRQGVSGSLIEALPRTGTRLLIGADWFAEAYHDPVPPLEQMRQPVLALWGELDRVTPPAESARIVQEALERGGNTRYAIRFFPHADHTLHTSTDGFVEGEQFAPDYVETVTSWVSTVARDQEPRPGSAEPTPAQARLSRPLAPLAAWESGAIHLGALALPALAFAFYLAGAGGVALMRHARQRPHAAPEPPVRQARRWARWLAGTGLAAMLGLVGYLGYLTTIEANAVGPVVAARPLPWIALQVFAVGAVASTLALIVAWWLARGEVRGAERARLGVVLSGGVVFIAWAAYWGLLMP